MLKGLLGGIVTLLSPLSYHSLAKLLVTAQDDAQDEVPWMLRDLHAILDIPKDSSRLLHLHHPSFRDFLFEKARSEEFWVDEKQMHQVLADRCISLMSTSLKQGMCGEDALGILVAELERSQIKRSLPPEVQYACLHWIQHLQKSDTQFNDIDKVHQFLQDHLLHWLEALGWMGKLSEGVHAIASLKSFAALSDYIDNAKRFIPYNRASIEQAIGSQTAECETMPPSPLNDASAPRKRGRPPGDKSKKPAQGQQGRNLNYRHKQKQQQEQANHGRGHAIDSQTALRRGRGRPRKIQQPTDLEHEGITGSQTAPKRGRGRPRKIQQPTDLELEDVTGGQTAPKRGRGRPRKIQPPANPGHEDVTGDQTAPKRGRGRPRKIQPPAGPGVLPLDAPNLDQDQAPNDEGRHEPPLNEESALVQTPPTSGQMDEPEPHGQDSIPAGREEITQRDVNTKRKLRGQGAGRKRSATSLEAPLAKRWHAAASSSDLSSLSIGWNTED